MTVLNPDRDLDDLGAVNAALGGDLKASALYGLGDRAGNSVGKGKTSVGEALGISLSLPPAAVGSDGSSNGGVTEGVEDLPTHSLVLYLLGGDGPGGADLLGSGGVDSGDQDLVLGDTGGSQGSGAGDVSHRGGNSVSQRGGNVVASTAEEPSVSLSIGISRRGGVSKCSRRGKGKNLRVHVELDDFPRWLELKSSPVEFL